MTDTCEACRYWKACAADYVGTCQRFPKPYMKQPTDWCGEWKQKRQARQIAPVEPARVEPVIQKIWCDQCDLPVTTAEAARCRSRFCKVKGITR